MLVRSGTRTASRVIDARRLEPFFFRRALTLIGDRRKASQYRGQAVWSQSRLCRVSLTLISGFARRAENNSAMRSARCAPSAASALWYNFLFLLGSALAHASKGDMVSELNQQWHKACFTCSDCNKVLDSFVPYNNKVCHGACAATSF